MCLVPNLWVEEHLGPKKHDDKLAMFVTITGIAIGHSDDHGPVIIRRARAACVRSWFESPVFAVGTYFQAPKAIHASPLLLMNKQLLGDSTDTNRPA